MNDRLWDSKLALIFYLILKITNCQLIIFFKFTVFLKKKNYFLVKINPVLPIISRKMFLLFGGKYKLFFTTTTEEVLG